MGEDIDDIVRSIQCRCFDSSTKTKPKRENQTRKWLKQFARGIQVEGQAKYRLKAVHFPHNCVKDKTELSLALSLTQSLE